MGQKVTLREVTSWGQWSSSWAFVAGLVVILLGPSWWSVAIGAWFGFWLVLGMGLAVKRGGWGFWAALVLEAFIIFAGVGVVHWLIESSRAAGADAVLQRIHNGEDWKATQAALTQAQGLVTTLTTRLNALPPDFVTAAGKLTSDIATQQTTVQTLAAHLTELEAGAKTAQVVTGATAFEAFGPNTVIIVLFILGIGNELVALANMARRKEGVDTVARPAVQAPVKPAAVAEMVAAPDRTEPPNLYRDPEPEDSPAVTVKEFVDMRLALLRQGLPNGYRPIIEAFAEQGRKLSDRKARELNAESIRLGLVKERSTATINTDVNHSVSIGA